MGVAALINSVCVCVWVWPGCDCVVVSVIMCEGVDVIPWLSVWV